MNADILDTLERSLDYILSEAEKRDYDPPAPTDLVADLEYAIALVSDAINNQK